MSEYYQTNLLQSDDVSIVEAKVDRNFARMERMRKGLFARINELEKKNAELERRLSLLERNICQGNIIFNTKEKHLENGRESVEIDCKLSVVGE